MVNINVYNEISILMEIYLDINRVEYTDCLGRTRQCLKKDLEFFKKKDSQLAENIQPRIELNVSLLFLLLLFFLNFTLFHLIFSKMPQCG